jgi:hypothetical protein
MISITIVTSIENINTTVLDKTKAERETTNFIVRKDERFESHNLESGVNNNSTNIIIAENSLTNNNNTV